jgi:8-oxo-dGTP diphosphatase
MPKSDQGVTQDRYTIIPRTLIFIMHGEEVLLLKGSPSKRLWANRYNGIGGHVEKGEDILSAARRELFEETKLLVPELRLCGTIQVDTGDSTGIGIYVFRGTYHEGTPVSSEEGVLEWVHKNDILNYPLVEDLQIILPKVFSIKQDDNPFFAVYSYNERDELQIQFGI